MKVCIVTLIRTVNSGSYLQGAALGKAIEKLGHEVCFYNTKRSLKSRMRNAKITLGMLFLDGFSEFKKQLGSLRSFSKLQRSLPLTRNAEGYDCIVLGSDTIWNIEAKSLSERAKLFWGTAFNNKVITFAGSAANSGESSFVNDPTYPEAVARWSAIGVRDGHTRTIISRLTDKPIEMNCDPTLLFDREYYEAEAGELPKGRFLFLYCFDDFTEKQTEELKRFAEERGLEIVQGVNGRKQKAADRSVENSPENFIRHMLAAEYVITDTFHGTAFSINFRKDFAVMNRGKNKVLDLLSTLGYEDRLVSKGGSIVEILNAPIDRADRSGKLESLRAASWEYLKKNI